MKVTILTPLFPPDIGSAAVYAKLLTEQLVKLQPTVVAYGLLPESVTDATILTVSKRTNKISLVYHCVKLLKSIRPSTLIVLNGPSSDLPALLFSYLTKTPVVYIYSDIEAKKKYSLVTRFISRKLKNRAVATLSLPEPVESILPPEQLPFKAVDESRIKSVSSWWEKHGEAILKYVK